MNEVGMVKLMIEHGADPNCPANRDMVSPSTDIGVNICEGDRPLHVAAKLGRLEIVRLLLNWAGADPNTTNKTGPTKPTNTTTTTNTNTNTTTTNTNTNTTTNTNTNRIFGLDIL